MSASTPPVLRCIYIYTRVDGWTGMGGVRMHSDEPEGMCILRFYCPVPLPYFVIRSFVCRVLQDGGMVMARFRRDLVCGYDVEMQKCVYKYSEEFG